MRVFVCSYHLSEISSPNQPPLNSVAGAPLARRVGHCYHEGLHLGSASVDIGHISDDSIRIHNGWDTSIYNYIYTSTFDDTCWNVCICHISDDSIRIHNGWDTSIYNYIYIYVHVRWYMLECMYLSCLLGFTILILFSKLMEFGIWLLPSSMEAKSWLTTNSTAHQGSRVDPKETGGTPRTKWILCTSLIVINHESLNTYKIQYEYHFLIHVVPLEWVTLNYWTSRAGCLYHSEDRPFDPLVIVNVFGIDPRYIRYICYRGLIAPLPLLPNLLIDGHWNFSPLEY